MDASVNALKSSNLAQGNRAHAGLDGGSQTQAKRSTAASPQQQAAMATAAGAQRDRHQGLNSQMQSTSEILFGPPWTSVDPSNMPMHGIVNFLGV